MTTRYAGTHLTWFLGRGPIIQGSRYKWLDPRGDIWHDDGAQEGGEGPYASGLPYNTPGIALPDRAAMGRWCRVSMPNQNLLVVVRCVDIGPRKPVLDLTAQLAFVLFTRKMEFPDYTPWTVDPLAELPEGGAVLINTRTGLSVPVPDAL